MLSQQHESTEDVSPIFDLGELSISNPIDRQPFVTSLRRSSSAVSAFGRSSFAVKERLCTTPEKSPDLESDDETHGLNRFCSTMTNVHGEYEAQRRRVDEYE